MFPQSAEHRDAGGFPSVRNDVSDPRSFVGQRQLATSSGEPREGNGGSASLESFGIECKNQNPEKSGGAGLVPSVRRSLDDGILHLSLNRYVQKVTRLSILLACRIPREANLSALAGCLPWVATPLPETQPSCRKFDRWDAIRYLVLVGGIAVPLLLQPFLMPSITLDHGKVTSTRALILHS